MKRQQSNNSKNNNKSSRSNSKAVSQAQSLQPSLQMDDIRPITLKKIVSQKQIDHKDEEEKKQQVDDNIPKPQLKRANSKAVSNNDKEKKPKKVNLQLKVGDVISLHDQLELYILTDNFKKDDQQIVCRSLNAQNDNDNKRKKTITYIQDQNITQLPKNTQFIKVEYVPSTKPKKSKKVQQQKNQQQNGPNLNDEVKIEAKVIKETQAKIKLNIKQAEVKKKQKENKGKKQNLDAIQPRAAKSEPRKPPKKRQRLNFDGDDDDAADDNDEEEKKGYEMIKVQNVKRNNNVNNDDEPMQIDDVMRQNDANLADGGDIQPAQNKRGKKAAAKKQPKAKKVYEPPQPREEVDIPDVIYHKNSQVLELPINCCQTCSNRHCVRAVNIDSVDLFIKCQKSRANVSSLIEHIAPELRYSSLEKAIQLNRVEILEILLTQDKPESDYRMKKRESQIASFETGEVSKMAFGYKVRKVQMMRGNRQGNNAFTEDPTHVYQTPIEYLTTDEYCVEKCFQQDGVNEQTIELLKKYLGDKFIPFINDKALPIIMRHGCYDTLCALFKVIGDNHDVSNHFFNTVNHQLLTAKKEEDIKINAIMKEQMRQNDKFHYQFVAALNPSGVALKYLKSNNLHLAPTAKLNNTSTVFQIAVCSSIENFDFITSQNYTTHDLDTKKRTPLMWALMARKPFNNIYQIIQGLTKQEKDLKDDRKLMALHYFCKYGVDQRLSQQEQTDLTVQIMNLFVEHKAKFSQVAGYNKYTPLLYASIYGHIEIVKYLIENIPRLNINKGDKYLRTPLAMACRNGHADIASLLIKYNADINKGDSSGNTPLHYAAAYGWLQCVEILIKYDANPSPENAWKSTPITIALQKNHIAVVKELLKSQEINVDSKDDEGRTLLSLAMNSINHESIEYIDLLINQKGSNVNQQDSKGRTPLYSLVESMSKRKRGLFQDHDALEFKIVKILLSSGADLNLKTKDGKSAFTLAFENGMTDLLDIFGSNIDLNKDPSLLFAFSGVSIMKHKVQQLIVDCCKKQQELTGKAIEDETINHVNDDGFTPLLFYVWEVVQNKAAILRAIQKLVDQNEKNITNNDILESVQIDNNVNLFGAINEKSKKIYNQQIIEPFIEFLQFLIDNGANPNAYILKFKQYRDDIIPQTQASQHSQLIQAGGRRPPEKDQYVSKKDANNESLGLNSVIHLLIEDQATTIRELFDFFLGIQGIELNQVNFMKMTPFFKLVKTRNIKDNQDHKYCFEQLLASGKVDIDAPDQFGMSAFWYFYTNNRVEEAFYLVDKGANINHMDNYGFFALKRELFQANYPMIQRLLGKGANTEITDEFQRTILHLSCDYSHRRDYKELFKILINHKANLSAQDFKGRTPLHYMFVKKNQRHAVDSFDPLSRGLDILINKDTKKSIDINHQDINGKSILHYAAQRNSIESLEHIIKVFGEENLNFDLEDKNRNTPLAIAIGCKHILFAKRLIDLKLAKLKSFIYVEKIVQRPAQNVNFGGIGGMNNFQDDEQSDMEFMQVQNNNQFNQDDKANKKHDKDADNLFRYIIRNNLVELEKAFIDNEYDKIQMVIDYICEGFIGKLFKVIETHFKHHTGAKGSILIQQNDKGQNLIHVLAKNSHLIKNSQELETFYKQLQDEGVNDKDLDNKGRSALHHAIRSGNLDFIKLLVEKKKFDVNQKDNKGANSIVHLLKGDRILKADIKILKYLIKSGADTDILYQEPLYQDDSNDDGDDFGIEELKQNEKYETTCVIHAIRHPSKERDNIRLILKELLEHSNPSQQDSTGKDAFFQVAIRNHFNTFNFILDIIEEKHKSFDSIIKDSVDRYGKSLIHYIVNPLNFGSYENTDILERAIEVGFKHDIKDNKGKTPYDYACLQMSGVMKEVFDKHNLGGNDVQMQDANLYKVAIDNEYMSVDFEEDAKQFLLNIQMQIDPHKVVPCDASGKFNDDCVVMYDDHAEQYFDVYMTRVEIGKFQPGGDYLFYKMQLVLDKSRDLAILLTRWGRIGEEGAFQKTPFNTHQDAIDEFKKVFEQKSGNKWSKFENFHKKWRKFQLMRPNYVTIDQKNYLQPFDLENSPQPNQQNLQQSAVDIMREICDVNTYLRALDKSGVDAKAMPFSNIDRKNLYDALDVLQKLNKTLVKLEGMNPRPYAESERNKLLATREKMWYLSSRFYEFIPHEEFRNKMVPPISNIDMLLQKSSMIQNLIEIETASKILLGAHQKANEINPLEYCLRAAGVRMNVVDRIKDKAEFDILYQYAENTYTENQRRKTIKNIIRLTKYSEQEAFKSDMSNRMLLFHGSRVSNFLGILKHGLRVQPLAVQRNGQLLGKGIYFSDMLSKSLQYTEDQNANQSGSRYIVVCEVALGDNVKEVSRHNRDFKFEEGTTAIQGMGRQAPDSKIKVVLPDGTFVPLGKVENQAQHANSEFQYNEYVVPEPNQVRMRYLIQLK